MAYRFNRDEPIADGIRRIAEERLDRAIHRLKQKGCELEAVHQARKDIKKLRALLRLVRVEIGNKVYQRDTATLREAAQKLAPARDARVLLETFDKLVEHFKTQLPARPFPAVRGRLSSRHEIEEKHFLERDSAEAVIHSFEKLHGRLVDWLPAGDDWSVIEAGIERAYRGGRNGLRLAQKDHAPEHFHEWRKRAKDLWYQIRLICPAWPEVLGVLSGQLDELSDQLGDHHDLAVLRQTIAADCTAKSRDEVEALTGLLELRMRELESSALVLGNRLYTEKAPEFCKRLGRYWEVWHQEEAEKSFLRAIA